MSNHNNHSQYFQSFSRDLDRIDTQSQPRHFLVKSESIDSPDLPPSPKPNFHFNYQYAGNSQNSPLYRFGSHSNHNHNHSHNHHHLPSTSPSTPSFTFMSSANSAHNHHHTQPWTASSSSYSGMHHGAYDLPALHDSRHTTHAMAFHDDYEDADELSELPETSVTNASGNGRKDEKQVRRRSSKACDQCRKSKCKCERTGDSDSCKNCVLLATPCTFLGPSRKRGPPKGYIDAIEARLHQTEALIGILLGIGDRDQRARTLFEDLSQDPLAKDIINRVDSSPYGTKGRRRDLSASGARSRHAHAHAARPAPTPTQLPNGNREQGQGEEISLRSTHPSNEWQDQVTAKLYATAQSRCLNGQSSNYSHSQQSSFDEQHQNQSSVRVVTAEDDIDMRSRPVLSLYTPSPLSPSSEQHQHTQPSPIGRRQRRRMDGNDTSRSPGRGSESRSPGRHSHLRGTALLHGKSSMASLSEPYSGSRSHGSHSPDYNYNDVGSPSQMGMDGRDGNDEMDDSGDSDGLADAVGQLSLNEHEEVRYHSKVSGLHLLGVKERVDGRSEGGIWKFPSSRVWPPLPGARLVPGSADDFVSRLPDLTTQEHLLEMYFTYVHTALPILHKKTFMEDFKNINVGDGADSPQSPDSAAFHPRGSPIRRRRRRIPTLLLLVMFSIAARYSATSEGPLPPQGSMWPAGDKYLEDAKRILDSTYASSQPTTCQALLLMGYREVGIGAMAQAWLYIGMAVRMAQDLGMHKSADRWQRSIGTLFTPHELQERKRIWYSCVIMDKYVSTYIGRPLAIFERDFDNGLPSEDEVEEFEEWRPHTSDPLGMASAEPLPPPSSAVPGRIISCFNASARLSIILSRIVQSIYPIHPIQGRYAEAERLEKELDKWYLELPEHLRYDPASSKTPVPLPHILTLHMQYWCTVLLLHRPFIRHLTETRHKSPASDSHEEQERAISQKNYDMCVRAANYTTSIVSVYLQTFCIKRSSVFLCYYIFTASIMHVTTLTAYPNDPQARMGLTKLMDALEKMEVIWPSARRARELIDGSRVWSHDISQLPPSEYSHLRHKRPHETEDVDHGHVSVVESALRNQNYSSPNQPGYPLGIDIPSGDAPSLGYLSAFDRWAGDSGLSFSGSLSTSVLPQQYSTGLVDERAVSSMSRGQPSNDGATMHARYPQYWNDYSTLGQLGTTYGLPTLPEMSHPHQPPHSAPGSHNQHSPMYLHEQYQIFNNLSPTNP